MSFKSILVHVEPPPGGAYRLSCAVDLADRFGATLLGVGAEAIQPLGAADPFGVMGPSWVESLRTAQDQHLAAAEGEFRRVAGSRPALWRSCFGVPSEALAQYARAADLIVVGDTKAGDAEDPFHRVDRGELLLTGGLPVLSGPSGLDRVSAKRILLAWKNTRESRRAIHDAMPFLIVAAEVLVYAVAERGLADVQVEVDDVVAALCRHGVNARGECAEPQGRTSKQILDRVARLTGDLVVAGGYGRSRLGEWVFGGVTQDLLKQQRCFVLLSH